MQIIDPSWWKSAAVAVMTEPLLIPLLIVVGAAVWWFRGIFEQSARAGLSEQNKALEEHRKYAETRFADVSEQLTETKKQAEVLRGQIEAGVPQQQLLATANSTVSAVDFTLGANSEVRKILAAPPPFIFRLRRETPAPATILGGGHVPGENADTPTPVTRTSE